MGFLTVNYIFIAPFVLKWLASFHHVTYVGRHRGFEVLLKRNLTRLEPASSQQHCGWTKGLLRSTDIGKSGQVLPSMRNTSLACLGRRNFGDCQSPFEDSPETKTYSQKLEQDALEPARPVYIYPMAPPQAISSLYLSSTTRCKHTRHLKSPTLMPT